MALTPAVAARDPVAALRELAELAELAVSQRAPYAAQPDRMISDTPGLMRL